MNAISLNSIKSIGFALALVFVFLKGVVSDYGYLGWIIVLAICIALMIASFNAMDALLRKNNQSWSLLIPGTALLSVAGIASVVLGFLGMGDHGSGFFLALATLVLLGSFAYTCWYNAQGLGVGDGIIVAVMQSCFSLLFVVFFFVWKLFLGRIKR